MRSWIVLSLLLFSAAHAAESPRALSPSAKQTQYWEIHANNTILKPGATDFQLEFYWVPREWVEMRVLEGAHPSWIALIDPDPQSEFVRWFVHPADQEFRKHVQYALKISGFDSESHFLDQKAHRTASRSSFLEKHPDEPSASLRLSLTDGFGRWTGRQIDSVWGQGTDFTKQFKAQSARFISAVSEYLGSIHYQPRNLILQRDVITATLEVEIKDSDWPFKLGLGLSVRDLSVYDRSDRRYIPAFASHHSEAGTLIPLVNGYLNPNEFWSVHDGYVRGKAMAELFAMSGLVMDSPHSQQWVIEFDEFLRPTGRLALRDLGDVWITDPLLDEVLGQQRAAAWRTQHGEFLGELSWTKDNKTPLLAVGWNKGNNLSKHVSNADEERFFEKYWKGFAEQISVMTGVSQTDFQSILIKLPRNQDYDFKMIDIESPIWHQIAKSIGARARNEISSPPVTFPSVLPENHRELKETLLAFEKADLGRLKSLSASNPRIVIQAGLIRLASGKSDQELRNLLLSELEKFWGSTQSKERDLLCQSLVRWGSRDLKILTHQLRLTEDYWSVKIAIDRIVESGTQDVLVHRALAKMVGEYEYGSHGADLIRESLQALKELKFTDETAYLEAYRRLELNGRSHSYEFDLAVDHLSDIPAPVRAVAQEALLKKDVGYSSRANYLKRDRGSLDFLRQHLKDPDPVIQSFTKDALENLETRLERPDLFKLTYENQCEGYLLPKGI